MTEKRRFLSLRTRFVLMLVLTVMLSMVCGGVARFLGEGAIEKFYLSDEACEQRCRELLDEFEQYVQENEITVTQAREISRWAKGQDHVYLLISDGDSVVVDSGWWDEAEYYSAYGETPQEPPEESERSSESDETSAMKLIPAQEDENQTAAAYEESYQYGVGNRSVTFQDGTYLVSVYDFSEEPLYEYVNVGATIVMLLVLFGVLILYHNSVIRRIIALSKEVERIAEGNLSDPITIYRGDEIGELADHVELMRNAVVKEMSAEQEAWNANRDLITRMSHDIRTPLTVLLGFLELLEEGNFSEDEAYRDYLSICKKNAFQMKELADKLFQYFLVFSQSAGKMKMETADAKVLLQQLVGEHVVLLQEQGWQIKCDLTEADGLMEVDSFHMKRLFDNLFSNIEKYADIEQPVTVQVKQESGALHITFVNAIRQDPDQVESTNMGLKTCERIAELMNGSFHCGKTDGKFITEMTLPLIRTEN